MKGRAAPPHLAFLLGDPVDQSLSPLIHNTAFAALGLNARYQALKVGPQDLVEAVANLRRGEVLGANVTIPHKEAVVEMLDDLTPSARNLRAVNTIIRKADGRLEGSNTDVVGFLWPLEEHANRFQGGNAVVLGSGGAARAVTCALVSGLRLPKVSVVARRVAQAEKLVRELEIISEESVLEATPLASASEALRACTLIVNTTPVGMAPEVDETPITDISVFTDNQLVYDLVYAPRETRLLRDAAGQGATTIGGIAMLVGQAAASFRLWTGMDMPVDSVWAALGDTF